MNKRLSLILISVLLLTFTVFFCCCGIDTSTVAGSASQIIQQDETEDEITDEFDDEDLEGGANSVSLRQARENYKAFGCCEERFKGNVRKPTDEEIG